MVRWWAVAGLAGLTSSVYCIATDNRLFYRHVVMRAFRVVDAETAHVMAIRLAQMGLMLKFNSADDKILSTKLWGKDLSNPIGLAAGFDKDAKAFSNLFDVGFGFVEVGSVTPLPQGGNPRPRVFRLLSDQAIINRYGFNSCGQVDAAGRLKLWELKRNRYPGKLLGVNLGINKNSEDAFSDYQQGITNLGGFADYIVVNVSSPNTPGLRKMQEKEKLLDLLTKVKVDGLIVSNTTLQRPPYLKSVHRIEKGGLSGHPLKDISTQAISEFYCLTKGEIPIVGVGGIASGQDAYEKILAGASAVQLYSALVYHGPVLIKAIKEDLAQILRENGFSSVQEAVGKQHRQ